MTLPGPAVYKIIPQKNYQTFFLADLLQNSCILWNCFRHQLGHITQCDLCNSFLMQLCNTCSINLSGHFPVQLHFYRLQKYTFYLSSNMHISGLAQILNGSTLPGRKNWRNWRISFLIFRLFSSGTFDLDLDLRRQKSYIERS